LDTAGYSIDEGRYLFAGEIDALVSDETALRIPDLYLTYGSSEAEVRRRAKVRAAGTKVIFLLRNLAYYHPRSFSEADVILTPSRFSSEQYRARSGVDTVPLPPCLCPDDSVAPLVEPVFCTFINPSPEKGVSFFLSVLQAATEKRRDIPFLVVESRGSGLLLQAAAGATRMDLTAANLYIARNTAEPWRIYSVTRVLLVPSTGPETAGLVALEAQLNGIPVIASDRGGLPETVSSGGFILPVWDATAGGEPSQVAGTWLELICRLYDEPDFFRSAARASYDASARYRNGDVDRLYLQLFEALIGRRVR
jgi:glycosyltransferase involved in cell wall biosynthesis